MNHRDIIRRWERVDPFRFVSAFAADAGVTPARAALWHHRGSIPRPYWQRIAEASKRRGVRGKRGITLGDFARG